MKLVASLLFSIFAGSVASAQTAAPCANYAKYGALRVYHATMGTVQGSDGAQADARHLNSHGDEHSYVVTISDNNEDGEGWEADYGVRVRGFNQQCQVVFVKELSKR
ncbi:MAG: hypothetical protein KF789_08730 [Bdellovibrionaceae bacterium]|nr:hypothetical protein [Pseudobdellovibrionaceae bacterium]